MATRPEQIPGFDIVNDGLRRADLMAAAERAGVSLDDAVRAAQAGDTLELDLITSGFYSEDGEQEGLAGGQIEHELALRNLGDLIIRLRETAVERRWGVDEQTLLNFAFNAGHHYVEVDRARRAVVPLPAPRDAVRRKIHKMPPWYRHQHSRLSGGNPSYHIEPTTDQQEDKDGSQMAERIARWLAKDLHSHHNRSESAQWQLLAGNAVLAVGLSYEDDPEYLHAIDPESGEAMPIPKPQIVFEVLAPQFVWADDRVSRIRDLRWIGVDRPVALSEALAAWPGNEGIFQPELGSERGHSVHRRTARMTAVEDPWEDRALRDAPGGMSGPDEEEEVLLLEFHGAPGVALKGAFLDRLDPAAVDFIVTNADPETGEVAEEPVLVFPDGLHVTLTTDGHVLEVGPHPFGFLGFQELKFSKSPGLWSNAPATFLREINQAINWAVSMWEEGLLRHGRPKELWPRQARIARRGGTNSAQRVYYRANHQGAKPEYMTPPTMPSDGMKFLEYLEMVWQDVAGIHEVSQGKLPSADTSGIAVSLLQEQDLAQLGFAGTEMETAFTEIMKMALLLVQRFFPRNDPRLVKLAGDTPYLIDAFMAADLENNLDISVVKGTVIPRSPAAVKAEAIEAWQLGIMLDDFGRPDIRRMKEIFELGTADQLYAEDKVCIANARRIQDAIMAMPPGMALMALQIFEQSGQLPVELMPQPEDNHMVMEREHRIKLQRLRADPRAHPVNVALLRTIWQIHLTAVAPLILQAEPSVALGANMLAGGQAAGDQAGEGEADEGEAPDAEPIDRHNPHDNPRGADDGW